MATSQPKSNAQHQKDSDDRQRAMGRKGRKVWATPAEHEVLTRTLREMRENL